MDILTIVHIASYVIVALLLLSLPIRLALFSKKVGKMILPLIKTKIILFYIVIFFSIAMLIILYFRDFSLFIAIILHATAVLAVEMSVRELIHRIKSGVYENALSVDGKLIYKHEIILFPTLEYETESTNTLNTVTEKKGTITLFFTSIQERVDALAVIESWQKK